MNAIYAWLTHMLQKLTGGLPAEETEEKKMLLKLDLQFFADKGEDDDEEEEGDEEGDGSDGDDEDDGDETPNLDELLKDPAFKKQYNAKMKEQLGKRMKKHERQLEKLKGSAGKGKDDDQGDDADDSKETQAILARAERREKRALVKEYAADHGHSPKLLARLIDIDAIELDDDGDPENLDELIEDLEEEFPELFGAGADDDDDEEEEKPAKKRYTPGAKQKGNKKKKPDPVAQALADIQRRHGKKKED